MTEPTAETVKSILHKDFIKLASGLSPGVKLKMQMQFPSADWSQSSLDDHLYRPTSGANGQYLAVRGNGSRTRAGTVSKRPAIKKSSVSTTLEDQDDKGRKPAEAWVAVYNLLEMKRLAYKKEWKNEVLAHSVQSKQRLELYDEKRKRHEEEEKKKRLDDSAKKDRSFFVRVPIPNREHVPQDAQGSATSLPTEQSPAKSQKDVGTVAQKIVFKRVSRREKSSPLKVGGEKPTFRPLSIDKPPENDAKIWVKTQLLAEKRLARAKQILIMTDTALKVKSITSQTLAKSENEKEMWDSKEQLDFSKVFTPSDTQTSIKPKLDMSILNSSKMQDISKKIEINSRRAYFIRKPPTVTVDTSIAQIDINGCSIDDDIQSDSFSEKRTKNTRSSLKEGNAPRSARHEHHHSVTTYDTGTPKNAAYVIKTAIDEASAQRPVALLKYKQFPSFKGGLSGKSSIPRIATIVPLTIADLLNDPSVKVATAHAPLRVWKYF